MWKFILVVPGILYSLTLQAKAQDVATLLENNAQNASNFMLDLNTPTAPGFVVIGASPKSVADPGNFKEFSAHTASFVDEGKLKPGLAISAQPFWLFNRDMTLEQYAGVDRIGTDVVGGLSKWERVIARTQLSAASVEGNKKNGKTGVKLGLGFQTQLIDRQDPRNLPAALCLVKAWDGHAQHAVNAVTLEIIKKINQEIDKDPFVDRAKLEKEITEKAYDDLKLPIYDAAKKECEKEAEMRFLRSPSWMVGAGAAGLSNDGKIDDLSFDGVTFWSTYRRPFGSKKKALVFFVKTDVDRDFKVAGNRTASGDAYEIAISYALEETTWKLDATASYQTRRFDNSRFDDDFFKYSATAAYKVKEGVWLEATAGTKANSKSNDENFGLVQLKTNLSGVLKKIAD